MCFPPRKINNLIYLMNYLLRKLLYLPEHKKNCTLAALKNNNGAKICICGKSKSSM